MGIVGGCEANIMMDDWELVLHGPDVDALAKAFFSQDRKIQLTAERDGDIIQAMLQLERIEVGIKRSQYILYGFSKELQELSGEMIEVQYSIKSCAGKWTSKLLRV
jgi:hypothetical protein